MEITSVGSANYVSTLNSTTTLLTSDNIFTGTSEDVTIFSSVTISIFSDVSGVLEIQFSSDNSNWDHIVSVNISGNTSLSKTVQCTSTYFRIKYTNGSTNQTEFRLQSLLNMNKSQSTILNNKQYQETTLVSENGGNLQFDSGNNIQTAINNSLDSFGNIMTTNFFPSVISNFYYNINESIVNTSTTGSGSISHSEQKAILSTGTTNNSITKIFSKNICRYLPGTGVRTLFTAHFNTGVSGTTQFVGMGTDDNGLFFGYSTTGDFGILRRTRGVDNFISQSNWNVHKCDGTENDSFLLNPQYGNVYMIQMQWLGFGQITFSIENPNTGKFIVVHTIQYSNSSLSTHIGIPALYTRGEIDNKTTSTDISLGICCMTIYIEGYKGFNFGELNSMYNQSSIDRNEYINLLTIKNKTTFNSVSNFVPVILEFLSFSAEGSRSVIFKLLKNADVSSLTGWTDFDLNKSVIEYTKSTKEIIDFGNILFTYFVPTESSQNIELSQYEIFLNPGDTITIVAKSTSNNNDQGVSLTWRELF